MHKFLSILLLLSNFSAFSQSNEKIKAGAVALIDSETNWTYILDSSHKKITAFDEQCNRVWTAFVTFPERGNTSDLTKPKWSCTESIWSIEITNDVIWVGSKKYSGEKIIFIEYESSCSAYCVGVVYLKSGKFYPKGCD
jgi:hypothetical protein